MKPNLILRREFTWCFETNGAVPKDHPVKFSKIFANDNKVTFRKIIVFGYIKLFIAEGKIDRAGTWKITVSPNGGLRKIIARLEHVVDVGDLADEV
jgi:hypothetical protein